VGGRAIIWDIVDPMELAVADAGRAHDAARDGAGSHSGRSHGGSARQPAPEGHKFGFAWLTALRMLWQFRRTTPARYDFVKGPDGPHRM
jgi:hypothetical protein